MAGLTDDELKALTDAEMRNSIGYFGGKLAEQRRKAEYYYLGLAKGDLSPPEIEGRSSVVSTDVRNTVESMLPALMAKFCGGDTVVEFEPTKFGDEEKAQSATDYLNYLFWKKNNGHAVVETWFKDALLQKVGVIKVYWDTRHEEKREEYKGLNDVELAQILDDDEVEPIEHTSYVDEEDQEQRQQAIEQLTQQAMQSPESAQIIKQQVESILSQPPVMLHDIAVKRVKTDGKLTIEPVPPEEFLISRKAKSIESAAFVAHRVARTVSELRSMGYKNVENIQSDDSAATLNAERVERLSWDDEQAYMNVENTTLDESQRLVWVTECYIRADRDGDGIAELLKVVRAGNEILDEEVVDCAPFVSVCPVKLPHKFFGLSIADLAMEAQRVKTNLLRANLDNLYLQVNGRYFAVDGQVNLDDLLTSRPGGVVRIKNQGAVGRLDQATGDAGGAQVMMEYMQDFLENSTGWTRYSQGTDADSLNKTATGVLTVTNRADMRLDLIARNFAEGFVELFRMMLKLVLQNQDKEAVVRLNGNYVSIDPREWRNGFDVNISVGIGTGDKTQLIQSLQLFGAFMQQAGAVGLVGHEQVKAYGDELAKAMGLKNAKKFLMDQPVKQGQQEDPAVAVERMKQQGEQQKIAAEAMLEREKTQLEQEQARFAAQVEAEKKALELEHTKELELIKAQHQAELEKWKAQLDSDTKVLVAQINAQTSLKSAAMSANSASGEMDTEEYDEEGNVKAKTSLVDLVNAVNQNMAILVNMQQQSHGELLANLNKPKQIVRGPDGRVAGVV